ncbi:MAG: dephospho-CoA kinase [Alphaproteobacteria bacterium]|nr:dephospho-CoA kinase [Alphaproteobacteria bacterium]
MKILGLTGGIGMGKSTAARSFSARRVRVFDADAAVHLLQSPGGRAVAPIGAAFPGTVKRGRVEREALRDAVLGKPEALRMLERIIHPLVRDEQRRFLARARRDGQRLVVLDIPLLFETRRAAREFDAVVVVSAPAAVQRARVLRRPGMTADRLAAILARQMPDAQKRARADIIIRTGGARHATDRAVRRIVRQFRHEP